MLFTTLLTSSLFVASVVATAQPFLLSNVPMNEFGKRQTNGYAPTYGPTCTHQGDTCETSCGPTYIQCPSTDGSIHCFDTTIKSSCCSDGSGYICGDGYYCTKTAGGRTWCCPNGLDLVACAAAYTLTEALQSVTTAAIGPSNTGGVASATVSTTAGSSAYTTSGSSTYVSPTTHVVSDNSTLGVNPTATNAVQFTGAAVINRAGAGGVAGGMFLAAGALLL